jgi:hypothetical protein
VTRHRTIQLSTLYGGFLLPSENAFWNAVRTETNPPPHGGDLSRRMTAKAIAYFRLFVMSLWLFWPETDATRASPRGPAVRLSID